METQDLNEEQAAGTVWTRGLPTKEGWYLWRKHCRQDPFDWDAYFFAEGDPKIVEDAAGWWRDGTGAIPPKGGEWLNVTPNAELTGDARRPSRATCSIALPKITDEMVEAFHPWLIADDGDGYTWNQAAVDFACVLKAECFRRAGKQ